jgi:hypothetical protein
MVISNTDYTIRTMPNTCKKGEEKNKNSEMLFVEFSPIHWSLMLIIENTCIKYYYKKKYPKPLISSNPHGLNYLVWLSRNVNPPFHLFSCTFDIFLSIKSLYLSISHLLYFLVFHKCFPSISSLLYQIYSRFMSVKNAHLKTFKVSAKSQYWLCEKYYS